MTVEIGNTDAEGRLVLADALGLADEESPDCMIDIATLTGAARVALGPGPSALYTDDEALAAGLLASGRSVGDPVWRMPLWAPYDKLIKSNDRRRQPHRRRLLCRLGHRGAVPEALCQDAKRYAHLDIFGWVPRERPDARKAATRKARARCSPISVRNSGRDEPRDCRRAALVAAARSSPKRLA